MRRAPCFHFESPIVTSCRTSVNPSSWCSQFRTIHNSLRRHANPLPITAAGPPPSAPLPAASQYGERVDRRRRQAELVKKGQELRDKQDSKAGSAMRKRFWKDVHVKQDEENNHIVHLDTRPVRNPSTQSPLLIPPTKPHLATAIALEWDNLTSAQQALQSHLLPLTSIASRAQALMIEDAKTLTGAGSANDTGASAQDSHVLGGKGEGIRYDIINMLLRYLDTDTLLCWAPPPSPRTSPGSSATASASTPSSPSTADDSNNASASNPSQSTTGDNLNITNPFSSLRALQIHTATPILAYLSQYLWPGVELRPALDTGSILPRSQPAATRAVIKGWLSGLPAYELVGLERAVLASKSLCVGARLIAEWGEGLRAAAATNTSSSGAAEAGGNVENKRKRFGVEEAAEASSLEVRWQTGMWGEVEDSHDVEREDLARQFGSVVVLVSGTGAT